MQTIVTATAVTSTHIRLAFDHGESVVIDFTPYIKQGGVFAPLQDPSFFAQVKIGERGRYLTWSDEIDFCADALWLKGKSVEGDEPSSNGHSHQTFPSETTKG